MSKKIIEAKYKVIMTLTTTEFAQKIYESLLKEQKGSPFLNSKVKDVSFEMYNGRYKKVALPPQEVKEGYIVNETPSGNICFEFENGHKLKIPTMCETFFLKFTPVKIQGKYLYTIKCEEPSEFSKELKQEVLKLVK